MKILIVDDERVSRKKMENIMQPYGRCYAVESGTAAIKAFTEALLGGEQFKVVTLDVSMPDMSGDDVLSMIRTVERTNNIPRDERAKVFMVSSHSDQSTVMASIEAGCDDYIKKPFTAERVTQKLRQLGVTVDQPKQ